MLTAERFIQKPGTHTEGVGLRQLACRRNCLFLVGHSLIPSSIALLHMSHLCRLFKLRSLNYLILYALGELHKIGAVAGYPDNQVSVVLRVLFGIQ